MQNYKLKARKIFDAHSHIGKFGVQYMKDRKVEPFQGREVTNAQGLRKFMDGLGITKALVVPHFFPDQTKAFEYNQIVLDTIQQVKNVYGGLWVSPLENNTQRNQKVLESLPIKKVKALKMCANSWPKGVGHNPQTWNTLFKKNMADIIQTAKKYKLILQVHSSGDGNADFKTQLYPFIKHVGKQVKIQILHMGADAGGIFAFVPRFIELLKNNYDLYCDSSFVRGFAPHWLVTELIKKYPKGLDRVMFASDNPWDLFESAYWRVEAIKCNQKIKNKIFYKNACMLYEA